MYLLYFSPLFSFFSPFFHSPLHFLFFLCDRLFGDDFIVVLAILFRMTNSDIEPRRTVIIT